MMTAQAPQGGVTLGGDKNYDTQGCVAELRARGRYPARGAEHRPPRRQCDRWTHHTAPGLQPESASAQAGGRNLWLAEDGGGMRKTRFRGKARVGWMFTWALAAYNLVRMRNLLQEAE